MAIIKSWDSTDSLKIDGISKAARVIIYNSEGKEKSAPNSVVSRFLANSGNLVIQAIAHSATAGFFWLINPVGNNKNIRIRSIGLESQATTALVTLTAPRVTIERVTFIGVASGTQILSAKIDSLSANPSGLLLTTSVGLTLTVGAIIFGFLPIMTITAVGAQVPVMLEYEPKNDETLIVLMPGEGIVCRQPDAGTTADTRKLIVNLGWEEYIL